MGRIEINREGFRELRRDPKLVEHFKEQGKRMTTGLNAELALAQGKRGQKIRPGYVSVVKIGRTRARLYVHAWTPRAMAHEQKHDSLLKLAFRHGGRAAKAPE